MDALHSQVDARVPNTPDVFDSSDVVNYQLMLIKVNN